MWYPWGEVSELELEVVPPPEPPVLLWEIVVVALLPPPPMQPLAATEKATKNTTSRAIAVFAFINNHPPCTLGH